MGARGGSRSWVALLVTALMFVPLDAARVRAALNGNTHDAEINADHAIAQ